MPRSAGRLPFRPISTTLAAPLTNWSDINSSMVAQSDREGQLQSKSQIGLKPSIENSIGKRVVAGPFDSMTRQFAPEWTIKLRKKSRFRSRAV